MFKHAFCKRALALLLIAALLVGALTVSAFAATAETVRHYDNYASLGDSVASGFGPDNIDYVGLRPVDFAYHSLVADAVTADTFNQMARPGCRLLEIRYYLEADNAYDSSYFMIPLDEQKAEALKQTYQEAIRNADLITLNAGSNDVITQSLGPVMRILSDTEPTPEALQKFVDACGGALPAMLKLFEMAKKLGKVPEALDAFTEALSSSLTAFRENWDLVCRDIYALNPDVTLVAVGYFNPMSSLRLTDSSMIQLGQALDVIVALMNLYVSSTSQWAQQYLYADVFGTECYELPAFSDERFATEYITNVHPTHDGHKFMAQQILSVLPERTDDGSKPDGGDQPAPAKQFPFTDVPKDKWFYNYVYDCWDKGLMDGMTDTTFAPDATTTRAQLATVLWRMADSPAVTDADRSACPFTDLTQDWYKDAVVWAYQNKIVNGVTDTTFVPNEPVTREQMVSMLYRYKEEPATAGDLSVFADRGSIAEYARPAVAWAVENGVVDGVTENTFQPKGTATRAQLAAILSRADQI